MYCFAIARMFVLYNWGKLEIGAYEDVSEMTNLQTKPVILYGTFEQLTNKFK